ncbi:flagellar hook-associated protein 3 [Pseudomonas daroniae]|uniref:Flagellar hook-associated protein 3 n=1 Tax=Phytopseudomonas daroniae TaxID=2487519 RepID=A0A4Q9QS61_9GAMM|nr:MULTISPECIES: flagellar hook-associated protein 3 [Pseudomonas]TBU77086.1 flagellar hook-associated protein 3 [Pseudomonas daroniae]TBU83380.1 flagellar hook-associated protein 3 [Pseudomonas daroniae]TBU85019.1 flagellar hook-associated protein 3 [Pseudomonas sp. FRB 228]TBU93688.1 flagellar hook-associated protein 3 [Pseudomonas daroniae]
MRISTSQMYSSSISGYSKGYSDITKTYEQISSGKRVNTPADDPVGAARLLQLEQQQAQLTQYSNNMSTATNSLSQQESTLRSMTNVLQRARELSVRAGSGSLSDEDRTAIAQELDQIQEQLLTMMNGKDANGQYLFAGAQSGTQPFVKNADGSYSYQGDQNSLSLQVSSSMSLIVNDNGWSSFENVPSVSRTTSTLTESPDSGQAAYVGQGQVSSEKGYKEFAAGAPYALELTSDSEYIIYSVGDDDKTPLSTGTYDSSSLSTDTISFHGVDFQLNVSLDPDSSETAATQLAGHVFELNVAPDSFSVAGNNSSSAQISGGTVADMSATGAYKTTFPANGIVIQFNDDTNYAVYAQPRKDGDAPLANGALDGSGTISYAGASFTVTGTPAAGDSFSIKGSSSNTQGILETISTLSSALKNASDGDVAAQYALNEAVAAGIGNIDNAMKQVDALRTSVGARLNTIDTLSTENESLSIANASTQSSIRDTDMAAAISTLMLQQTKLEAAQAAFARIAQLSLFDKL